MKAQHLVDAIVAKGLEPSSEIEKIAREALGKGIINEKMYLVLQYRVPFPGVQHETLQAIGYHLGTQRERPRQIESKAYSRLKRYIDLKYSGRDYWELPITKVFLDGSWPEWHAEKSLERKFGRMPTIGEVHKLFEETPLERDRLSLLNHNKLALNAIYKSFARIDVTL